MRQSPSLLALLTIAATLGFASQARSESLLVPVQAIEARPSSVADLASSQEAPSAETSINLNPNSIEALSHDASLSAMSAEANATVVTEREAEPTPSAVPSLTKTPTEPFVSVDQLRQQLATSEEPEAIPAEATSTASDPAAELTATFDGDTAASQAKISAQPIVQSSGSINPLSFQAVTVEDQAQALGEADAEALPNFASDDVAQASGADDTTDAEDDADADTETDIPELDEAQPEDSEPDDQSPGGLDADRAPQETQVLVAEVAVADPDGTPLPVELEDTIYETIDTRPGQTTTRTQLQQDINSIFATGFFANVRAQPSDTPLGVRVTFLVEPNPVLSQVNVEGDEVLPETVVEAIFEPQYGEIINLLDFQDGIVELNEWYQENGYVLAQVVAAPEIEEDGIVTLQVAEGVIEDIEVRFLTDEGFPEDEEGNPVRGKTREFIITRELETEPGDVFQQDQIQSDLQRVFGLGIFDDINLTLNPGKTDPRRVNVVVNVIERSTGSVSAGAGFNFTGDLFGTLSYRQDNFGGNNQKFSAETQLSTGGDILFDVSFTDPWIAGDPNRTSYTANAFARRSISLVFEGGPDEINLPTDDNDDDDDEGDRVRIQRFGGGVSFRRPLGNNWSASLGTLYQRVRTTDEDGNLEEEDAAGNPLSFSGDGVDDLWTVQFGIVQDLRNNSFAPTSGSVLRLGTEQSIPLGAGNILFNRLRASYSYYIPVSFLNFNEGPQALAFNVQGGTILGDLPPYEAFALGGTNSVRGYEEGEVGAGRSYLQASMEYRFPLFSFLGGAVFLDAATDLGSGDSVPGSPGPDRGKPGSGVGVGAGVRIQTPLGPIRIDYGFGDQGEGRLHFGIGERF